MLMNVAFTPNGRVPGSAAEDVRDGGGAGAVAGVRQAVEVLDGPQHVVVVDVLAVGTGDDARAGDQRRDLVAGGVVVLVPGHDQQAVVGLGPLGVGVHVVPQPGVGLGDRAV